MKKLILITAIIASSLCCNAQVNHLYKCNQQNRASTFCFIGGAGVFYAGYSYKNPVMIGAGALSIVIGVVLNRSAHNHFIKASGNGLAITIGK